MPRRRPRHVERIALTIAGGDGGWVLSFYRFHPLAAKDEPAALDTLRDAIERSCRDLALKGTVLLAPEGVNAALCGRRRELEQFVCQHFPGVSPQWCPVPEGSLPFRRLKVRAKREIVGFGRSLAPDAAVGRQVDGATWNALIADDDVLLLDVRNDYESAIGAFRGAMLADIASFRSFSEFAARKLADKRQRIAMYCTGGIRCEKASAHLIEQGFEDVCQLEGGILRYLAETPADANAFEGECFVFDDRVAVDAHLARGSYSLCQACGWPRRPAEGGCRSCGAISGQQTA